MRKCLGKVKGDEGMLSTERGYSVIERIRGEGILIGEEKGLKKGIAKGRNEGILIGEKKNSRQIAAKMIAAGMPSSTISGFTEIPISEIEKLRKKS